MTIVSFIFRTDDDPTRMYGKIYLEYLSDDHEGIDHEIKYKIHNLLNAYRTRKLLPKIINLHIGVIGTTNEFSTDDEKTMFDVYIREHGYSHYNKCKRPTDFYCFGERFVETDIVYDYHSYDDENEDDEYNSDSDSETNR
jgi:hypothetical protein